ncbi:Retrotransposon gag protein [Corchorus olitorius]|uniref:Retrotransposon gag protein n=1 Tax=Corchorus olitorius TaxID=93759 RepID=A0A1R3HMP9_9ROSI|nr:Retrotransposon gag protein [Corchorus olitorius]
MTSGVSVTPVRLFQETPDTLSTEVTTNVDTSSALPTSNGVNLSGTDTQWPFSTDLNLTPSSGLFTISSPELEHAWHERSTPTDLPPFHPIIWVRDQDRGARLRSEVHAEQSVSSTVRSRDRARDADRTQNREGSRSQTRGNGDRQNRRSISQHVPDLNEIPTRTELLAPARAEVATREERGRRRDRSRRDATYTDNNLAAKIEQMQEEIKRLKRADRTDATPQDWNETVENYTKRFNNTCLEVDGLEDEEAIRMYMEGLQECRFFWVLWENPPTSLKSLFDKVQRYIEAKKGAKLEAKVDDRQ